MRRAAILSGLLAIAGVTNADAGCVTGCARQEASAVATEWNGDAQAPTRLILSTPSHALGEPVWIALEIKVADGWYVYATPNSDAAPKLEWAGSTNLAAPALQWPSPELVNVNGRQKQVYKNHVILPISVAPLHPAQDIVIGLHVTYAVCADVCRPGEAVHNIRIAATPLTPPPAAQRQADDIARAVSAAAGP